MRKRDQGGLIVLIGYVLVLVLLSSLAIAAAARAEGEEGIGEAEPAKVYEPPEGSPEEPPPPPDQDECPADPDPSAAEVEYSTEATQLPAICRALADRLDRVRERGYWTAAELRQLREDLHAEGEDLAAARAALEALRDAQCEPDCVVKIDSTEPVAVTGERDAAEEVYGPEIVSAIQAGSEGTNGALWFLIGICVFIPPAAILWATVKRGLDT